MNETARQAIDKLALNLREYASKSAYEFMKNHRAECAECAELRPIVRLKEAALIGLIEGGCQAVGSQIGLERLGGINRQTIHHKLARAATAS